MPLPAVIFGGPSSEHDVSILTGLPVVRALGRAVAIYWAPTGDFYEVDPGAEAADFVDGPPRKAPQVRLVAGEGFVGRKRALDIAAVVNCCHGGPGEDGTLQAALDLAGVRYTGPTMAGAALGMDKLAFGNVVAAAGLPTLPRTTLTPEDVLPSFSGPYIVKPRFGGSSIGIEVVEDLDTARALMRSSPHLRNGAVVEPYLPDAVDLNVAIRTWPEVQLSAVERPLRSTGGGILGFADKYRAGGAGEGTAGGAGEGTAVGAGDGTAGGAGEGTAVGAGDGTVGGAGEGMASAPRELPAALPDGLEAQLREAARHVAALAGVRGVARLDFLLDGDHLVVNEINTIPGSLARYLWVGEQQVPFDRLLADLLAEAEQRPTHRYSTAGADGTALRSAGSIAGKLG